MIVEFEIHGNHIRRTRFSIEGYEHRDLAHIPRIEPNDTAADCLRKMATAFNVWQEHELTASHKATCAK